MKDVTPKVVNRYETLSKAEANKPQKKYPSVTLDLHALPEAKDWKVGKEYIVTLRLKMTGLSMRKTANPMDSIDSYNNNATFDVTGTEVKSSKKDEKGKNENTPQDDTIDE